MWTVTLIAFSVAIPGVAWSGRGQVRPATVALGIPLCLSLPFLVPAGLAGLRVVVAVLAFALAMKLLDVATGRRADGAALDNPVRRAIWALVPPDVSFPRTAADRDRAHLAGRRGAFRVILKAAGAGALLLGATLAPELHGHRAMGPLWALSLLYVLLSGVADLGTAILGMAGVRMAKVFDLPPLARSPRELWGRRWNRYIKALAFRHLFVPLDGRHHPLRATAVVFLASGLMHEYLIFAALGRLPDHAGWMTAFFAVHGLAVAGQMALERALGRRRPRLPTPVAVGAHLAWLIATAPLFLAPLGEVYDYMSWRLW